MAQDKVRPGELTPEEIQADILRFFSYYPGVTMPETIFSVMKEERVRWSFEQMIEQITVMVADSRLYQREDGAVTNDIAYLVA